MEGESGDRTVTRLRAAVLVGAVLGVVTSGALVGAIDVSAETATVTVTNDGERTETVRVVVERDGSRVERTRTVAPGETVSPVALFEDGTYVLKVYADGSLCAHATVAVAGANPLSSGTVTTTGNSLSAACETDVTTADGPRVRAG